MKEMEVARAITEDEAEAVRNVIFDTNLRSGLRVGTEYNRGYLTILAHPPLPGMVLNEVDQQEERIVNYGDSFVGGIGITNRTLPKINEALPGLSDRLHAEHGKVVILGNGFSNVPLLLAARFEFGSLSKKPAVLDLVDYHLVHSDLVNLKERIESANLSLPRNLPVYIRTTSRICEQLNGGNLLAEQYCVGSGQPPEIAKGADLAINCHGPNGFSIAEQASLLGETGELYTSCYTDLLPDTFSAEKIYDARGKESYSIIRRK